MKESVYCKYAREIVDDYCSYVEKTYQLYCYGRGGGFIDNFNNIDLSFNGAKDLSVIEARILIIECTQELLRRINHDVQIKPYLSHYPFTEKGINLLISPRKKNGDKVDSDFVALCFTCNGMLYYYVNNPKEDDLKKIYEEPYQKALEIVAQVSEKQSIIFQKEDLTEERNSSKIAILCQYLRDKFSKS